MLSLTVVLPDSALYTMNHLYNYLIVYDYPNTHVCTLPAFIMRPEKLQPSWFFITSYILYAYSGTTLSTKHTCRYTPVRWRSVGILQYVWNLGLSLGHHAKGPGKAPCLLSTLCHESTPHVYINPRFDLPYHTLQHRQWIGLGILILRYLPY
jgi:hypothetical protein